MGLKFITRMAVWPVPMPRKTRPGAMRLMEAMECAVTGAMRVPAMATPVPRRMVEVWCAAKRQRRVAIRPDHLRVWHPAVVEALVLGVNQELPVVDVGGDTDAELHSFLPLLRSDNAVRARV